MDVVVRAWLRTVAVITVAIACAPAIAAGTPAGERVQLITTNEDRIIFEVDLSEHAFQPSRHLAGTEILEIRGFGRTSDPGEPSVPSRRFLIGLPPQGEPTMTWRVLASRSLGTHRLEPGPFPFIRDDGSAIPVVGEEYRIDEDAYEKSRTEIAVAAEPVTRIRHQRALPVEVVPVGYDPSTGETVLATRIRIEISMNRTDSGGRRLEDPQRAARESPVWNRLFGRILVNPQASAGWRRPPARPVPDLSRAARVSEALSGPLVKLHVRDTGFHRVSVPAVTGKGFPDGVAIEDLRLFKRGYDEASLAESIVDVPYRVIEDPVNGVFDGSDWLVFYAQRLGEDESREDPLEKFSASNVYWLGTSGGTSMDLVAVAPGFVSADTATASFPVIERYERDDYFFEPSPPGEKEFYYFNDFQLPSFSTAFVAASIDPSQGFQLRARLRGGVSSSSNRLVKLSIRNSLGNTALDDAVVRSKNVVSYTSQVLPGNVIDGGDNTFQVDPTPDRPTLEVLLDWFTIEYHARYRARGDVLEFNSASLMGDTSITITGLGGGVMLFDVTDPLSPREYLLTPAHFTDTGDGRAVSFRETYSTRKEFVLTPLNAVPQIGPDDVVADAPSALIGGPAEGGVDVLVVSHADFLGEMERWVSFRRAQGYGVLMADAQDVFDEFNGGVTNPRGIKKFIRHFVETGGASFVVLVGDASEDNKQVMSVAGPNFVPTESYSEYAGGSFNQDEVVTTDSWYTMLDSDFIVAPPTLISDYYPEVIIGRLPFGSPTEARDVIDKILRFETPRADEIWRRRMIRVADNAFSGGLGGLCYQSSEIWFQLAEEEAAQTAESSIPGGFDIVPFYLAEYLADVEPPHEPGSCDRASVLSSTTRSRVTPTLRAELNAGASIVSFQAHMHRGLICHEFLFDVRGSWGIRDHLQLTNTGRPWIVFGMGCHMSDYAIWNEHDLNTISNNYPNGDALSELLLLQQAGAVSTYASTGFEYLTPNVNFTAVLTDAFFDDVPTDTMVASDKAQARWILGELMTVAAIENLNRNPRSGGGDGSVGQTKRYHLLGDPLLRIDAGPPRFDVTVNGHPFTSGDNVATVAGDGVIDVRAVITDEVAVDKISLTIAGEDSSGILTRTPLKDEELTAARQYEVGFRHRLQAKTYDVVLTAYQAEDTTAGRFNIAAEFTFRVEVSAELTVNDRLVVDGDMVPPAGRYLFKVNVPVAVDPSLIRVEADGETVTPLEITRSEQDTTTWFVGFSGEYAEGPHEIVLFVGAAEFPYTVIVGTRAGVLDLIAYPNPFTDEVYFVFTNELAITSGSVDVFTVTGKKVAHLDVPFHARPPGQNAIRWDGRTFDGKDVANGTYLFVLTVDQGGQKTTERGKLVRVR